jgi:hypothetical protein
LDNEDPILPVWISHNCEELWTGDRLEQGYNYLVYCFETEQHVYEARAYLHNIDTVSIHGPYEKDAVSSLPLKSVEIDQRVLAYLRRRYTTITRLGPNGYAPIE